MSLNIHACEEDEGVKEHRVFLIRSDLRAYAIVDPRAGNKPTEATQLALKAIDEALDQSSKLLDEAREEPRAAERNLQEVANRVFDAASTAVYEGTRGEGEVGSMALSVCLVLLGDHSSLVSSVGDARLDLLRGERFICLSPDLQNDHAGTTRGIPSRALGILPGVSPDIFFFATAPGDRFLLSSFAVANNLDDLEKSRFLSRADLKNIATDACTEAERKDLEGAGRYSALVIAADEGESAPALPTPDGVLNTLEGADIFKALTPRDIVGLMHRLQARIVESDSLVFREGSTGSSLYILVSGKVEVRVKGRLLRYLEAGSHFGEFALLDNKERSASVQTVQPSMLLELSAEGFEEVKRHEPACAQAIYTTISKRLTMLLREADELLVRYY